MINFVLDFMIFAIFGAIFATVLYIIYREVSKIR
jgi:hypothetical protein